jgi:hypothetical protein
MVVVLTVLAMFAIFLIGPKPPEENQANVAVPASSVVKSPANSSDREWPASKLVTLYAGFDSTLAIGQFGKSGMVDNLTANVCIGYLESMMAEYEFAGDLIPVTPTTICQEARTQFWPRLIRLEKHRTIMMADFSVDARLRLLRRYGYLINQGFDFVDQASRVEASSPKREE